MSVSRKSKSMKKTSKTSKRSKNIRNNKKTKKNLKKMKGGVRTDKLVVNKVYNFTYNKYVNAMYPDGKVVNVPMTKNKFLRHVSRIGRDEERLEFQNMDSNEVFQIDADYEDDSILQ